MKKFFFLFLAWIVLLPSLVSAAYNPQSIQFDPGSNISKGTKLGNKDPILVSTNIINWLLTLMGFFFLLMVLYGGWTWMSSQGNEENIEKAQEIIKAGVIGLLVILASYGIATYVFTNFYNATNL